MLKLQRSLHQQHIANGIWLLCAGLGAWWLLSVASYAGYQYDSHHYDAYEKQTVFFVGFGSGPVSAIGRLGHFVDRHIEIIFAGLSVAATIAIAWFTYTLYKTSGDQLRELKRSVDTSVAMELPIVFVDKIEFMFYHYIPVTGTAPVYDMVVADAIPRDGAQLNITLRNYGRTPARAERLSFTYKIAATLPPEPEYLSTIRLASGDVLQSGGILTGTAFRQFIKTTDDEKLSLSDGSASFWVYGMMQFRDFLGDPHTLRFCARWWGHDETESSDTPSGFFEDGPEAYRKSD
jgi:hypothetical protein